MRGTTAGSDDFDAEGTDIRNLREVRMNLLVRTRQEAEGFRGAARATENRATGAPDGYRRRLYTSTIMARNLVRRFGS